MDIFDVSKRDNLKGKMSLVLVYDKLWRKWCVIYDLYKSASLACLPKRITWVDFVNNIIKQHGFIFFKPLCDMDEEEFGIVVDNIRK